MKLFKLDSGHIAKDKGSENIAQELKKIKITEAGYVLPKIEEEEITKQQAENSILQTISLGERAVVLAGDHSSSFTSFSALAKSSDEIGLILFDAHPDCQEAVNDDEDWVRKLLTKGILKKENMIVIGIRSITPDELSFMKQNKFNHFSMHFIEENGINELCDVIMENARRWQNVYVSIDMDVIDPAFAPGVESPEPGGLTSRQIIALIQRLKNLKNIKMLDIAEVHFEKDKDNLTAKLAAKIISEFY